ncbi:MAG: leucyl aminopeptidase, partial [Actinomycetota bacterium]
MALFAEELALCGLTRDESVVVLTAGGPRDDYADAFVTAAGEHGAEAFRLDLPSPSFRRGGRSSANNPLANSPAAVEALKQCDLLIDLAYLLWTREQHAVQASGTRILTCIASVDAIVRLFPSQARKERVLEAASLLESARELRVTNDGGTDVTYRLGQYSVLAQYGFTDQRGRWDNFPSALVAAAGNDGSVHGQVVLQPGDILFPFNRYASEPVWF